MIQLLVQGGRYITVKELADIYHVSTRTIRSDLDLIEDYLKTIDASLTRNRTLGVKINKCEIGGQEMSALMKKISREGEYYEGDNREDAVIGFVLWNEERFTVQEIADKTNISKNSAVKCLGLCEQWLKKRNISIIKRKHYGMCLECREIDWRSAAMDFMNGHIREFDYQKFYDGSADKEYLLVNRYVNDFISGITVGIRSVIVKNFIRKYEVDFHIHFTDEAFVGIYLYICLAVKRMAESRYIEKMPEGMGVRLDGLRWMRDNKDAMESLGVGFPETEQKIILYYLLSGKKAYDGRAVYYDETEKEVVESFVDSVEKILCVDLKDDEELFHNLLTHIIAAVHRIRADQYIQNPLVWEIKNLYPEIYKACQEASESFERAYGKTVGDEETAFLAMHIAVSVEKQKKRERSVLIKTILVCASGIGSSNILCTRIWREFPDIEIRAVSSVKDFAGMDKSGVDLILSTVPLSVKVKQSVIYVSALLNEEDVRKIRSFVKRYFAVHKREDMLVDDLMSIITRECYIEDYKGLRNQISEYFRPVNRYLDDMPRLCEMVSTEKISLQAGLDTWEKAVFQSGKLLYDNGDIKKGFMKELLASRETLGPALSIAPGIVMPHAKNQGEVLRTSMSILTLKDTISFGEEIDCAVWMVICLCVKGDNIHLKALSELMCLICNTGLLEELRNCTDKQRFLEILKEIDDREA